jgi:hypothetical protein
LVLDDHGSFMADVARIRHVSDLIGDLHAPRAPHPDWIDEARIRCAPGSKTKLLGRGW